MIHNMIYKHKELLMQVCNILISEHHYDIYARSIYKYLLNCGNDNWQTYYKNFTPDYVDRVIRREYKYLIRSLNEFNRFKV